MRTWHVGRGGALWRALRVRGVGHGPIARRIGVGGRRGGERRALHDPISLMIVFERRKEVGEVEDGN